MKPIFSQLHIASKWLAVLFAAAALSGCLATVDGLKKDASEAYSKLSGVAEGATKQLQQSKTSARADEYKAFANADTLIVNKMIEHQKAGRLKYSFVDRTVIVTDSVSHTVTPVKIAATFRTELPADTVAGRHPSIKSTVDAMTGYIVMRAGQEPTRLIISATNASDGMFLKAAAQETLARLGASNPKAQNLPITVDVNSKYAGIGWMSEGDVSRVL